MHHEYSASTLPQDCLSQIMKRMPSLRFVRGFMMLPSHVHMRLTRRRPLSFVSFLARTIPLDRLLGFCRVCYISLTYFWRKLRSSATASSPLLIGTSLQALMTLSSDALLSWPHGPCTADLVPCSACSGASEGTHALAAVSHAITGDFPCRPLAHQILV